MCIGNFNTTGLLRWNWACLEKSNCVKGGNFLDVMTKVDTIVMDKTGTLTKGVFKVQKVVSNGIDDSELVG